VKLSDFGELSVFIATREYVTVKGSSKVFKNISALSIYSKVSDLIAFPYISRKYQPISWDAISLLLFSLKTES
jgi:hypothetical protein